MNDSKSMWFGQICYIMVLKFREPGFKTELAAAWIFPGGLISMFRRLEEISFIALLSCTLWIMTKM